MKKTMIVLFVLVLLGAQSVSMAQDSPAQFPGQIAYIGTDNNVYTLDGQSGSPITLTSDAAAGTDLVRIYQWPTWSTDGRLAYFLSAAQADGQFSTQVYVTENGSTPGHSVYTGDSESFNYASWSPQNCPNDPDCRDLAVLLSSQEANGLFVQLIHDAGSNTLSQNIGAGVPFYYSWSPDGSRMLWQRDSQHLDIYDASGGQIAENLPETPGVFSAPAWSPIDDRLLFGVLDSGSQTTSLVILANGQQQTLASGLAGPVSFEWSPDGNKVAYMDGQGPLNILDSVTGQSLMQTPVGGIYAFFWSPDSSKIAYVTLASPPGSINAIRQNGAERLAKQTANGLSWSVVNTADGSTRRYGAFVPTREMVYMLRFFDQFAQSHRIWSPDSQHLLYSELTSDNRSTIVLLDTTRSDSLPLAIAEGLIAVWSFN
jgi:dipeptidyl aminopeptidase/acylaminoacyl peptidase